MPEGTRFPIIKLAYRTASFLSRDQHNVLEQMKYLYVPKASKAPYKINFAITFFLKHGREYFYRGMKIIPILFKCEQLFGFLTFVIFQYTIPRADAAFTRYRF